MKLAGTLAIFLAFSALGFPATIYVPDDHATIQGAIDASAYVGDLIIVRPGTYNENIVLNDRSVTVKSERGADVTVIDGGGAAITVLFESNSWLCTLDGFTVTNGYGDSYGGGGISFRKHASGTITDNIITGNKGLGAGGVCNSSGSALITNNTINGNEGDLAGGIYCYRAYGTISCNDISGNVSRGALGAGGIYVRFDSSLFTKNRITGNTGQLGGGIGIDSAFGVEPIRFCDNLVFGNSAASGGGIYCTHSLAAFENNIVFGNAAGLGGGICCIASPATFTNNTLSGNSATGSGGGIYCENSTLTVGNTILWNNSAPLGVEMWLGEPANPSTVDIFHCDLEGGLASCHVESGSTLNWGAGNIDADPLFVDAASGDFHLTWPSPCRNGGENSIVAGLYDFENDDRIADGTVDIGADEYSLHLYHEGPVAPGAAVVFKAIGIPGDASFLLYSPRLQYPPEITPFGPLHLRRPLAFLGRGSFPAGGYDEKARAMPTTLRPGQRLHYQLLSGKRLSNLMELVVE